MADVKISGLPASTTPLAGTEVLPIVQGGVTKKVASDDLTVKNIRSNATSGVLQVTGPGTGTTRVMTTPDANFTAARTDAGQTFTGVNTFTSPKIITDISDTNGNELIKVTATASAVNEITVANAATGNNPVLSATGSDTNIGITLTPKGTGNAVLTSGNLAVANGNGIDFSLTPGTGTSELLADYEHGTFTIAFAADSGTITLNASTMLYTKVGRLVICTGYITVTSVSSPTGSLYFTGLPFTSNSASPSGITGFAVSGAGWGANAATQMYGYVDNNGTTGVIGGLTTSTGAQVPFASFINSGTFLRISIIYNAA